MAQFAARNLPSHRWTAPQVVRSLGRVLSPFTPRAGFAPAEVEGEVSELRLFDLACRHRLESELALLVEGGDASPGLPRFSAHTRLFLAQALQRNRARETRFRQQAREAIAALNATGIAPVLLKGIHDSFEGSRERAGARWMADIDLLVPREQRGAAGNALAGIGYAAGVEAHDDYYGHHLPAFRRRGEPGAIELHWELAFGLGGSVLTGSEVVDAAIPGEDEGLRYRWMPDEQRLAYLVMHAQIADRHHVRLELPLRALNDFAQLTSRADAIDWPAILERFRSRGAESECGSFLTLAHLLFDWPWPFDEAPNPAWARHAQRTLHALRLPASIRRTLTVSDELRKGFSLPVLERIYPELPDAGPWVLRRHHLGVLLRKHRGAYWARLAGRTSH
jgi:hypothetical protein